MIDKPWNILFLLLFSSYNSFLEYFIYLSYRLNNINVINHIYIILLIFKFLWVCQCSIIVLGETHNMVLDIYNIVKVLYMLVTVWVEVVHVMSYFWSSNVLFRLLYCNNKTYTLLSIFVHHIIIEHGIYVESFYYSGLAFLHCIIYEDLKILLYLFASI